MDNNISYNGAAKSLALVSGKGGSGKTLIATAAALGIAKHDKSVLLVDADFGTGGLTYYLGFGSFERARDGLAEYLLSRGRKSENPEEQYIAYANSDATENEPLISKVRLMPVGEHRIFEGSETACSTEAIRNLIANVGHEYDYVIFDCRGGIDHESLAVCAAVDQIVLVVETDAASIQASRHLSEIIHKGGLGKKLAGFVLNKVLDDPTSLAQAGISFFKCEVLASIPFDIDTTRRFIKGEIPDPKSLFCRHVFRMLNRLDRHLEQFYNIRVLKAAEYTSTTLRNPYSKFGGFVLTATAFYFYALVGIYIITTKTETSTMLISTLVASIVLVFASNSEEFKNSVGYAFKGTNDRLLRLLRFSRR